MDAVLNPSTLVNTSAPSSNGTIDGDVASVVPSLDAGTWFVLAVTLCVFFLPLFLLFPPFPPRKSDALRQTHTKMGVAEAPKSSRDKDPRNTSGKNPQTGKIKSLCVYPVESCPGIEVNRSKVLSSGLEFDRLFAFAQLKSPFPVSSHQEDKAALAAAKGHKWDPITQRQFPLLASLQVELWQPDLDKLKGLNDKNAQTNSETFLILRFPWQEQAGIWGLWELFAAKCLRGWNAVAEKEILLPMTFPPAEDIAAKAYTRETLPILLDGDGEDDDHHHQQMEVLNMTTDLPPELRLYLGVSNKLGLFRAAPSAAVAAAEAAMAVSSSQKSAPQSLLMGEKINTVANVPFVPGFHNSYPVSIVNLSTSTASGAADLESGMTENSEKSTKKGRKGPNVFVSGLAPQDEQEWKKVLVKPDSSTQDSHVSFRSGPGKSGLGAQMAPLFEEDKGLSHGFLEVGMSVEVLEGW